MSFSWSILSFPDWFLSLSGPILSCPSCSDWILILSGLILNLFDWTLSLLAWIKDKNSVFRNSGSWISIEIQACNSWPWILKWNSRSLILNELKKQAGARFELVPLARRSCSFTSGLRSLDEHSDDWFPRNPIYSLFCCINSELIPSSSHLRLRSWTVDFFRRPYRLVKNW